MNDAELGEWSAVKLGGDIPSRTKSFLFENALHLSPGEAGPGWAAPGASTTKRKKKTKKKVATPPPPPPSRQNDDEEGYA